MSELYVALGGGNLGQIRSQRKYDWDLFVSEFLTEFHESDVDMAEYSTLSREDKSAIKNAAGWFVGGAFNVNDKGKLWRNRNGLRGRSMVVLDLDHLAEFGYSVQDIQDGLIGLEYVIYSTPSSTPEDVRLRLVLPVDKGMRPDQYQPVGRWIAGQIGIEAFDSTGFEEARLMYLPVCLSDGPRVVAHGKGEWLNRDEILGSYTDWRDFGEWPSSEAEGGARKTDLKAEDPTEKRGAIGAFCRAFNIHDVIHTWLTDYFTQFDDSTYLPNDSTGAPGARVYDDEMFLYNNHETGPTSKRNLNAFDLVRILQYGDLDIGGEPEDITKAASFKAMMDFALKQPEVQSDLNDGEFDDVDPDMDPTANGEPIHTFDSMASDIAELEDEMAPRADTRMLMSRIANARFTPSDERALMRMLQPKFPYKPTMADLDKELKDLRQQTTTQDDDGEVHDLELELLEEFENEWYPNGTIKRIGKTYWVFNEGLWSMVNEEIIAGQFTKTIIRIRKERPDDAREIAALVGETKTSSLTGSLHKMMANLIAQRDTGEDPLFLLRRFHLPIINCRNGELWFKSTGEYEFRKHDPAHFFTTRIDTKYDPDAECPIFDAFLEHIFANAEDPVGMIQFIEELMGYIVNMSRWQKIWVMFYGETNTGKSTLAEVISALLGGSSVEKKLSALDTSRGGEFRDSGLIGKQVFIDDDMDKGASLPDGAIKRISEEKAIQTAIKWGDDLRFICRAFPLVCTNHWPMTNDLTDAFVHRTLVVPFTNAYVIGGDASDQKKYDMLANELPGILNRCIQGLARLRKRGHFALPVDVTSARAKWLENANPVAAFAAERLVEDADNLLKTSDIHDSYVDWHVEEYGSSRSRLPKREFYRRADAFLGGRIHRKDGWFYKGWKPYRGITPQQREFNADLSDYETEDDLLE